MGHLTAHTPWHQAMQALEKALCLMDLSLTQRAEMNPLSILTMGMRRPDDWRPAVMAVLGLFDHLCSSSAEARQAALDLGFQPLNAPELPMAETASPETRFFPFERNQNGELCIRIRESHRLAQSANTPCPQCQNPQEAFQSGSRPEDPQSVSRRQD